MSGTTTIRLTLIAPAGGRDLREARFSGDGPVDPAALARAAGAGAALRGTFPRGTARWVVSPSHRCRATADALWGPAPDAAPAPGPPPEDVPEEVPALAGPDMGRWQGRTLAEVSAEDPKSLVSWLSDPAAAPHGGESLLSLRTRVGAWLDTTRDTERGSGTGRLVAVVEPDVVRAAVAHALDLPAPAFRRLDVEPLGAVELTGRSGRWNLRVARALD
ncbi:histidine phosphatase family protein [Streptomyces sp. SID4919]|uniref:histidine phosphatase family protein n=1 Tax=unclassified Streptomyces TaxID=2593676 RepID=UPI0008239970|nr:MULTISPECIES: histidine phosphatase family protein [unclassified Streptomyces]MYY08885.1 histidine phosphatase family protein [Streptomyces sp. SID4919]SCK26182.1 Broad specificity phosphatase PhoE [Streptomyces sp. AmelKG-E11A]